MERLSELYLRLGTSLDLDETLSTLDAELGRVLRYQAISIHLAENDKLNCVYAAGVAFRELAALPCNAGAGLVGRAAAGGVPVWNAEPGGPAELTLAAALPLAWNGRLSGVLSLYRAEPRAFTEDDRAALLELAPKLAACIQNAQAYRRVDAANARILFERLDGELARIRRSHGRLAVLQCAVPGLDAVPGCAERLGAALRRTCREYDFVTQSGNSFIVVLVDFAQPKPEQAKARIERVFHDAGMEVKIGAAFFPVDGYDAEDLLAAAQEAAHA